MEFINFDLAGVEMYHCADHCNRELKGPEMTSDYLIQVFLLASILSFKDDKIQNNLILNIIPSVKVS